MQSILRQLFAIVAVCFRLVTSDYVVYVVCSPSMIRRNWRRSWSCSQTDSRLDFSSSLSLERFMHFSNLYITTSRLLLRETLEPRTAKKQGFKARVECVRIDLRRKVRYDGRPFHAKEATSV